MPYNSEILIPAVGHGISVSHDSRTTCQAYSSMNFISSIVSTNIHLFGSYYGIFHSTDSGVNWTDISNQALTNSGRYMPAQLLSGSDLYLSVGWAGVWKASVSQLLDVKELTEDNVSILPIPSTGVFDIKFNKSQNGELHIYNSTGQLILTKHVSAEDNQIDLTDFSSGIYLASLRTKEKMQSFKLGVLK